MDSFSSIFLVCFITYTFVRFSRHRNFSSLDLRSETRLEMMYSGTHLFWMTKKLGVGEKSVRVSWMNTWSISRSQSLCLTCTVCPRGEECLEYRISSNVYLFFRQYYLTRFTSLSPHMSFP